MRTQAPRLIPIDTACMNCGRGLAWRMGVGRYVISHDDGDDVCSRVTARLADSAREIASAALAGTAPADLPPDVARSRVPGGDGAGLRRANVRCEDCDLRYEEREQYGCGESGYGHTYDESDLQAAGYVEPPQPPMDALAAHVAEQLAPVGCGWGRRGSRARPPPPSPRTLLLRLGAPQARLRDVGLPGIQRAPACRDRHRTDAARHRTSPSSTTHLRTRGELMDCLSCTASTTNGLALCEHCQQTLRVALVNTGSYYADVDHIKPGERVRVRSAYQSTPPPLTTPARDPIGEALSAVANSVSTWCRTLLDDRPGIGKTPTTTVGALGWLESHVPTISTIEWCGELVKEMRQHERDLQRILDKADTGSYAGICGNEIGREWVGENIEPVLCARHLYGVESSAWVQCPECGRNWDKDERRVKMLKDVRGQMLPLRTVARILVRLTDEPSVERLTRRIEKWVEREQIKDYGVRVLDGQPRRVYCVGEVEEKLGLNTAPESVAEPAPEAAEAC